MKFAIPTENGKLCQHFGSCKEFTFIETDESKNIIAQERKIPQGQCHAYMVPWVVENSVDVVIAGGMGAPAQEMVRAKGIKVIAGAPVDTPQALVTEYLNGNLQTSSANTCNCDCGNH